VLIRGEEGDAANMGVSYDVRLHVGENGEDFKGAKKSSVSMSIRKVRSVEKDMSGQLIQIRPSSSSSSKGYEGR